MRKNLNSISAIAKFTLTMSLFAQLTGCGGGGGDASASATATQAVLAPVVVVTPAPVVAQTPTPVAPSGPMCPIASSTVASNAGTQLVLNVNRNTGVAPLTVIFDASDSTSSTTTRPFHDLQMRWNFGDVTGATWANGSRPGASRNIGTGPVVGHVFETPGTKSISVTDPVSGATHSCNITVQDPDVVFAGTKTKCFSKVGNFAGCPAGATRIADATGNFTPHFLAYEPTASRMLIQRGESWTTTDALIIKSSGPATLGAIAGAGAKPVINSSPNGNRVMVFSQTNVGVLRGKAVDWRVMDLELMATGSNAGGIGSNGTASQLTLLRLDIHDVYSGIVLNPGNGTGGVYDLFDQVGIVDTKVSKITGTFGSIGMFIGLSQSTVLGNYVDNNMMGEQVVRFPYANKLAISHNTLKRPLAQKNMLKIHSFIYSELPIYSQQIIVSDNILDNRGGSIDALEHMVIGNGGSSGNERVRNVIVERNLFYTDTGEVKGATAISANAPDITVRNNIANFTSTSNNYRYTEISMVRIATGVAAEPPARVNIYNNTLYSTNDKAEVGVLVRISDGAPSNIRAANNIRYLPNHIGLSGTVRYDDAGTAPIIESNNTVDGHMSPNFSATPPVALTDWQPATGSYAIGGGAIVPVIDDFFNNVRTGAANMGAVAP